MTLKTVAIRQTDLDYVKFLTIKFRRDEPGQTYGDTISYIIHHFRKSEQAQLVGGGMVPA